MTDIHHESERRDCHSGEVLDDSKNVADNETTYENLSAQVPFSPTVAEEAKQVALSGTNSDEKPRKMMGTKEKWGCKIPPGYSNSLVSEDGTVVPNHWADENGTLADWNYDEKDDPEDRNE